MRYVVARTARQCVHCKEMILEGEVVIQGQSNYGLMYHDDCHTERFGSSVFHLPRNEKPVEE